ncbi:MAG: hypothetical protein ABIQ65_04180 [Thermoanaerobaculia bacterium]
MLQDLTEFLGAVVLRWSNLLTGGFLVAAVLFYEKGKGAPVSSVAFFTLAFVFLLQACFDVWRTQKIRAQEAEGKASQEHAKLLDEEAKLVLLKTRVPLLVPYFHPDDRLCVTGKLFPYGGEYTQEEPLVTLNHGDVCIGIANRGPILASGVSVILRSSSSERIKPQGMRLRLTNDERSEFEVSPTGPGTPTRFVRVVKYEIFRDRFRKLQIRWTPESDPSSVAFDESLTLEVRIEYERAPIDVRLSLLVNPDGAVLAAYEVLPELPHPGARSVS